MWSVAAGAIVTSGASFASSAPPLLNYASPVALQQGSRGALQQCVALRLDVPVSERAFDDDSSTPGRLRPRRSLKKKPAIEEASGSSASAPSVGAFLREPEEPDYSKVGAGSSGSSGSGNRAVYSYEGDDLDDYEDYWAPLRQRPDRLRGSDLNELLQPDHLSRLRFINSPMQAYGALFKWDVLEEDPISVYRAPWVAVAEDNEFRIPGDGEILRALTMSPQRAITQTFSWTRDWGETRELSFKHFEASKQAMRDHVFRVPPGAEDWLQLLNEYGIPCCLCCRFDKASAELALEKAGIRKYFQQLVTAEDECETPEQTYLVSSIKVRRPPQNCVVFEDEPRGVASAHDATAKVVAMVGRHEGAGFKADRAVSAFDELTLMTLRDIFKADSAVGPPGGPPRL